MIPICQSDLTGLLGLVEETTHRGTSFEARESRCARHSFVSARSKVGSTNYSCWSCQMGRLTASFVAILARYPSLLHPSPHSTAPPATSSSPLPSVTLPRQHPNGLQLPKIALPQNSADRVCCDRNLMAPDSFKNLGFGDDADGPAQPPKTATATPSQQQPRPQTDDKPRAS